MILRCHDTPCTVGVMTPQESTMSIQAAAEMANVSPARITEFLDYIAATHGNDTPPTAETVHAAVETAQARDLKLTQVVMDAALHDPSYPNPYREAQVRPFLDYFGGGYDLARAGASR